MKVHALINLYNDRTFLGACLESLMDDIDTVTVADGAYEQYFDKFKEFSPWAIAWSTDGSMEILWGFRGLPDLHIIKTESENICWKSQVEKRNALINSVPDGDCFIIIDADEMLTGDVQESLERFFESGCIAFQMPLYAPGTQMDRVIAKWHPRIFIKRPGMHYKGTHWHLRDANDRIIEEKYPMFYTDSMAIVHFKTFKDQTRLLPHQEYMLSLSDRGWQEPTKPGESQGKEEKECKTENQSVSSSNEQTSSES